MAVALTRTNDVSLLLGSIGGISLSLIDSLMDWRMIRELRSR
jgi:hypothetical protein